MPTDALPTRLSRRQQDDVWGNPGSAGSILDFLESIPGIPDWLLGGGAVGAAAIGASGSSDSNSQEQPLPGVLPASRVPATQPSEDRSFYPPPKHVPDPASDVNVPATQPDSGTVYGPPKTVADPVSGVNVPATQPDRGTVWVPKFGGQ